MKQLALKIGGTNVDLPSQIEKINNSPFGINIIRTAINLLLFLAVILALFYIVYGGIKWITSSGDAKQVEGARTTIVNAAIGLAIAFLSMFLINFLGVFFKIPLFAQ